MSLGEWIRVVPGPRQNSPRMRLRLLLLLFTTYDKWGLINARISYKHRNNEIINYIVSDRSACPDKDYVNILSSHYGPQLYYVVSH